MIYTYKDDAIMSVLKYIKSLVGSLKGENIER